MKIEQHISQLLYRYQCVTVPEFGAFLTETRPAQLHEASHTFFPPKKTVLFNANIKNNDGLLANHIAQVEKISFETAVNRIADEVHVWKNNLQIYGGISLHAIGELFFNSENSLVFTPSHQINYLPEAFGLTSYVSPAIKRVVYKQETEALEEKAPITLTPEKRKGANFLKYAAVFLLGGSLLAVGGIYGNQYYQQKIEQETLLVQTKVQQQVNNKIQEATFFIDNPLPSVTLSLADKKQPVYRSYPYHVVAGAFLNEKNAYRKFAELKRMGYAPRILAKNRHGLIPVIYGSYGSYSAAFSAMQHIKATHPEAWLLVKE